MRRVSSKLSDSDPLHQVRLARAEFFEQGVVPEDLLRTPILHSWQRCLDSGLTDKAQQDFHRVKRADFSTCKEQNRSLMLRAEPVIQTLYTQIRDTESMVLLTDVKGLILHSLGDDDFLARARRVALQPGVTWDETNKGTNAIGTALAERAPVLVHGPEHFLSSNAFLTCSASPIVDPLGEQIGVLDISGDARIFQPHTLGLVRMSTQLIENYLFEGRFADCLILHFHPRPEFVGTLCEGIAVFRHDGRFMAANRSAQFQFGLGLEQLRQHCFESLFDLRLDELMDKSGLLMVRLVLFNGVPVYVRVSGGPNHESVIVHNARPRGPKHEATFAFSDLDLGDERIRVAINKARRVIARDINVVIQGETGSGKEVFARALHDESPRRIGPFVAVNCAAIPEGLIESELFGYVEGAFTGARRKGCVGKIQQANGGTLFLDEIGDMPLDLQARLLRVLQERTITPLGSTSAQAVDFSLTSATHRKLRDLIEAGKFREDLYYRLNGLVINLPPLRARSDLDLLIQQIVRYECHGRGPVSISPEVMSLFAQHDWPGNLRQLKNVIRTSVAMLDEAEDMITRNHLPDDFLEEVSLQEKKRLASAVCVAFSTDSASLSAMEVRAIRQAVASHDGNISAAARELGVSRNTLYRKLKSAGIE